MKKTVSYIFLISVLLLMLSFSAGTSFAQTGTDETATANDPNTFTLEELGFSERFLIGPYDINEFSFSLPDYWEVDSNTYLTLNITPTLGGAGVSQFGDNQDFILGTLVVRYNTNVVWNVLIKNDGPQTIQIPMSPESVIPKGTDSRHRLSFYLDASLNCDYEDFQTTVWIEPSSTMTFSYTEVQPELDLASFPRPYFQPDSVVPAEVSVVIPSNPTQNEIDAGMAVVAGLGSASAGESVLTYHTLDSLTPEMQENTNIIFVGNRFPDLQSLAFPVPFTGGKLSLTEDQQDNGVVQSLISPWSDKHVILFVSGNSDEAVLKAARAVSTGRLITSGLDNVSLVSSVNPLEVTDTPVIDQTLGDLGFDPQGVGVYGDVFIELNFNATAEQANSEGAYFDFLTTSSGLLDYNRSGLTVLLNDVVVGTFGFDSVEQTITEQKIEILPNFLRRGQNRLDIYSSLVPIDECFETTFDAAWVTVSDESAIHLPISAQQFDIGDRVDLGSYPFVLFSGTDLENIAFVLPKDNNTALESAAQIAYYLGAQRTVAIADFDTYYTGEVPEDVLASKDIIFVGKATEFEELSSVNDSLPAPFDQGSDVPQVPNMPVTFDVLQDVGVGYIQLADSPWAENQVVLLATGNSDDGISLAANGLSDDLLIGSLAGNYAEVIGDQMTSFDTRLVSSSTVSSVSDDTTNTQDAGTSESDSGSSTPDNASQTGDIIEKPAWVQPTIIGLAVVMVATIIFAIVRYGFLNRPNSGD